MSAFQRTKDANWERQVAIALRPYYPAAQRGFQTRGGTKECPDVTGTPWYVECKVGAKPNIQAALRQAEKAILESKDKRPPLVITKQDRTEPLVTMRMKEFLELVGRTIGEPGDHIVEIDWVGDDDLGPNAGTRPVKDSIALTDEIAVGVDGEQNRRLWRTRCADSETSRTR